MIFIGHNVNEKCAPSATRLLGNNLRRLLRFRFGVGCHAEAGADEIAVAVDVVDAAHARPEFADARPWRRERRRLARIGVIPSVAADGFRGVRGVFERVVCFVGCAVHDGLHFAVDGNERIAETVELALSFAFGGLDQHPAVHNGRQIHRHRMVPLVDHGFALTLDCTNNQIRGVQHWSTVVNLEDYH